MRIGITGTIQEDTQEFIQKFLEIWPNYKKDIGGFVIADELDAKKSYDLLNTRIDKSMEYRQTQNVLHTRTTIDSLAEIFLATARETKGFDELLIQKSIQLAKQSMNFYDVLFYLPIIEKNETDENALDNFYSVILESYSTGKNWIFPFDGVGGSPPMIEIFGSTEEKIEMLKLYINKDGQPFTAEDSLINQAIS